LQARYISRAVPAARSFKNGSRFLAAVVARFPKWYPTLPDLEPIAVAVADTLHRFCKKEHDWGWKKFMELSKVLEGFTVANTLVIKAQVQVIR